MILVWLAACGLEDGYGSVTATVDGESAPALKSVFWYLEDDGSLGLFAASFGDACPTMTAYAEAVGDAVSAEDLNAAEALLPETYWSVSATILPADDFEGSFTLDEEAFLTVCHQTSRPVAPVDDASAEPAKVCDDMILGVLRVDRFDDPDNGFTDASTNADMEADGSYADANLHAPHCAEIEAL